MLTEAGTMPTVGLEKRNSKGGGGMYDGGTIQFGNTTGVFDL